MKIWTGFTRIGFEIEPFGRGTNMQYVQCRTNLFSIAKKGTVDGKC